MKVNIHFIRARVFCYILSSTVILLGLWYLLGGNITEKFNLNNLGFFQPKGLNLSIDFSGGYINQVTIYSGIEQEELRTLSMESGLGNDIQKIIISDEKQIGNETSYLIKTMIDEQASKMLKSNPDLTAAKYFHDNVEKLYSKIMEKHGATYTITGADLVKANKYYSEKLTGEILEEKTADKRVVKNVVKESESVISSVYSEGLRFQAILLVLFVLIILLIYISFRFKFKFGIGALMSLLHDILIMIGFISFMRIEFDYTILGSILFIMGYSLNDTIVVYDRIRENLGIMKDSSPKHIINTSINQTLSRTIITSLTTFLAALALAIWGGPKIQWFAISIIYGIVTGTYSSIFIAAPVVDTWDDVFGKKKDKEKIKELEQKEKYLEQKQEIKEKKQEEDVTNSDAKKSENVTDTKNENIALSKKQLKKLAGKKKK